MGTLFGFTLLFALLVVLYFQIPASNERDWQPDVAVTPWAERVGDLITIHGVRNLDYRTETDFTPRWEPRTYNLNKLDSVDLVAVYWAGKAIAHIMLSFGFEEKTTSRSPLRHGKSAMKTIRRSPVFLGSTSSSTWLPTSTT
jgi:uncharacterized protein DUF4105